jgi:Gas vesicle synthesis protein GvpL/GvpF
MMNYGLYLYGIFPTRFPENLTFLGMDKESVFTKFFEGFTFLYSEAKQPKYLTSRRNLLGHEKVLEEAMHAGFYNLLPLRFGLVVKDWDAVDEQLIKPYKNKLISLFDHLAGKREVSIKIFWDSTRELQDLLEENQTLRQQRDSLIGKSLSMDETIAIGQRIEAALENRKRGIIQEFRDALNLLAFEVIESDTLMDKMIYNAAYLIPWDSEEKFSVIVEEIDAKFGDRLRIRYNNFTAPYTFAQLN